jgi:glycosyltransferase involved in cell wall biosynthesis
MTNRYCLYTAVLPPYRQACLEILTEKLGGQWTAYAGDRHLDPTVRSAGNVGLYVPIRNVALLRRRVLLQSGHWGAVLRADTAILDLNPRSMSSWLLLLSRRLLHRRTLLWGHLHPRAGARARTAGLRTKMRRLADGCIVYSYADADHVRAEFPSEQVWVAPNALYRSAEMGEGGDRLRNTFLYVGRLEPMKKPELLLSAFVQLAKDHPDQQLVFVGGGASTEQLQATVESLQLQNRVSFLGVVHSVDDLRALYSRAICAVSPGYAGLSLTQSLCFGVPVVVADSEPHAPEIELAATGNVIFFRSNSAEELAAALLAPQLRLPKAGRQRLVEFMRDRYSAEVMAVGLIAALQNAPQPENVLAPVAAGSI